MSEWKEIGLKKAVLFAIGEIQKTFIHLAWLPNIRSWLLRFFGARIGKGSVVMNVDFVNVYRKGFSAITIGKNCFIGDGCLFDLADEIRIGDSVTLGQRVMINTHRNVGFADHPLQQRFPSFSKPVRIGNGCFIGMGSILLAGVSIGSAAVIGAGSVVNKDITADSVAAGVPAKMIPKKESGLE